LKETSLIKQDLRFSQRTAVVMKSIIFWGMTSCTQQTTRRHIPEDYTLQVLLSCKLINKCFFKKLGFVLDRPRVCYYDVQWRIVTKHSYHLDHIL
jgi:hypothetical protein